MSDQQQGADWWLASDGKWYPPQSAAAFPSTPPLAPAAPAARSTADKLLLGGCSAVVIGSFLPWAKVTTIFGDISKAGTDGDGMLTMLLAAGAAALALARKAPRAIIVLLVLVAIIAIYDIADVSRLGEEGEDSVSVSVGFGLWIVAVGAAVGIWGGIQRRRQPAHADHD